MKQFKNQNLNENNLNLEIYDQQIDSRTITDLEFIMTNSAFGFEYALKSLEEIAPTGIASDQILEEVDGYRKVYFEARERLKNLDSNKLICLEQDLHLQKLLVFSKQKSIH